MAQLISKRYGSALFELAKEGNNVDKFDNDIKLVYEILGADKDFLRVLNNPQIASQEKLAILENAFNDKISQEIINFFKVVFSKNREDCLLEMLQVFMELVKEHKGIVTAEVISAKALNDSQLERIKNSLTKKLNKQVLIHSTVDPQVIGGLKINVDGHLIDNTIERHVNDIKNSLMDIKLVSKGV